MAAMPAVVAVACLALSGCSSSDPETTPGDPVSTDPASVATTTETTSATPGTDEAYLPVPDGVRLTPPGTELELGDRATAAWAPRQGLVAAVEVAVRSIERTTVADSLQGYDLSGGNATATPYFVTSTAENAGDTDLGGRQLPLYVVDSTGTLVAPTSIERGFAPCPGSTLPAVFAPGEGTRSCLIFLVASGRRVDAVVFRPPDGVVPLSWSGPVTDLAPDRPGRTGGPDRTGDRPRGRG